MPQCGILHEWTGKIGYFLINLTFHDQLPVFQARPVADASSYPQLLWITLCYPSSPIFQIVLENFYLKA